MATDHTAQTPQTLIEKWRARAAVAGEHERNAFLVKAYGYERQLHMERIAYTTCADELEKALRQSEAPPPAKWQPIATAPKDGTQLVLFGTLDGYQGMRACVTRWHAEPDAPGYCIGWQFSAPGYSAMFHPTFWMPRPDHAALTVASDAPPTQEENAVCPKCWQPVGSINWREIVNVIVSEADEGRDSYRVPRAIIDKAEAMLMGTAVPPAPASPQPAEDALVGQRFAQPDVVIVRAKPRPFRDECADGPAPAAPVEMHLRSVLAEWRKRRDNALALQETNADLDDFRDGIAWKIGALNVCITEIEEVLSLFVAVEPAPASVPPPSEELDLAQQLTAERKSHDATLKRLAEYAVELEAFRASSPAVPPHEFVAAVREALKVCDGIYMADHSVGSRLRSALANLDALPPVPPPPTKTEEETKS